MFIMIMVIIAYARKRFFIRRVSDIASYMMVSESLYDWQERSLADSFYFHFSAVLVRVM